MAEYQMEQEMGCGLIGGIFRRRSFQQPKTSVHSLDTESSNYVFKIAGDFKKPPKDFSKSQGAKSNAAFLHAFKLAKRPPKVEQKHSRGHSLSLPGPPTSQQKVESSGQLKRSTRAPNPKRDSTSESRQVTSIVSSHNQQESNIPKALVGATSSNVMLPSQLGNLRLQGNANLTGNNSPRATVKTVDYLQRSLHEVNPIARPRNGYSKLRGKVVMGNIMRHACDEIRQGPGLITRMDPEALKNMGNEKYKQGRFQDALALYDQAIALDSGKATFRCNRSAALIGLGRLLEAVSECEEAIKLDHSYQRAHHRLSTLYLRLGEPEKALHHYKLSDTIATYGEIVQAQVLQEHLKRCPEARRSREWNTLLKETELAISSGADSAPQVYAMQSEALLRLHRHQEAYTTYRKGPKFGVESCTNFFGPGGASHLLTIEAQVYLAAGRFVDAVAAAQQAARLDPSNKEGVAVVKCARAISAARLSGNMLFKALKFAEASALYSEGLEHDPYNSVLLCNRAACRIKLRQFEKAVEDCTKALLVQPNYTKARLRRADCNAKMERWEAAIQDYEELARESPRDEAVSRALFKAQAHLKRQRCVGVEHLK